MVPIEKNMYGKFYSGDSYIILHVSVLEVFERELSSQRIDLARNVYEATKYIGCTFIPATRQRAYVNVRVLAVCASSGVYAVE